MAVARATTVVMLALGLAYVALANKECEKLGFTGLHLCSDCESMAEYVKDQGLVADCKSCCVKDEQSNVKYASAKLVVCPYKLNGLPAIQDFIDKHASKYKGQLKIARTIGAYPKITLYSKDGNQRTSVRIDNWRVPTIHEYLQDKLSKPAKAA